MQLWNSLPSEYRIGLREAQDKARDLGLVSGNVPRANEDDYERYIIFNPMIYEETENGTQRYDLYSRLLKDRIIFLGRDIDDRVAGLVTAQLLFLESQDPEKDVNFYINSPGGVITSGMAIYDTMELIKCDIATVCIGQAASMGSFLLLAGTHGKRASLPHSRIMIHQPSGGAQGQATDIDLHAREILRIRKSLYQLMAKHTTMTEEEVEKYCNRDYFMSPEEAKGFGIIDTIIERAPGVTHPIDGSAEKSNGKD